MSITTQYDIDSARFQADDHLRRTGETPLAEDATYTALAQRMKTADRRVDDAIDTLVAISKGDPALKRFDTGDLWPVLEERRDQLLASVGERLGREAVLAIIESLHQSAMDRDRQVHSSLLRFLPFLPNDDLDHKWVASDAGQCWVTVDKQLGHPSADAARKRAFRVINIKEPAGQAMRRVLSASLHRAEYDVEATPAAVQALESTLIPSWEATVAEQAPRMSDLNYTFRLFANDHRKAQRRLRRSYEEVHQARLTPTELAELRVDAARLKMILLALEHRHEHTRVMRQLEALATAFTDVAFGQPFVIEELRLHSLAGPAPSVTDLAVYERVLTSRKELGITDAKYAYGQPLAEAWAESHLQPQMANDLSRAVQRELSSSTGIGLGLSHSD